MVYSTPISAVDMYCGAGGSSTGIVEACHARGLDIRLTVINHWQLAIATHQLNHPHAQHLCTGVDVVDPDRAHPGELDFLWASPECRFFSVARGAKPINDQQRATAWCVLRWIEAKRPKVVIVENVKDFLKWGPLGADDKPLPSKRGEIFRGFIHMLHCFGYKVDWKILRAADYGDPTIRERLFIQAVRGRRKITWPEPTHYDPATLSQRERDGVREKTPWVPARECIDFSLRGKSIFNRPVPLAEKTLRRIFIGLFKFGLEPFIMAFDQQSGGGSLQSTKRTLSTITTKGRHALVQSCLVKFRGTNHTSSIKAPVPAITAGGNHLGLVEYLVNVAHGNGKDINGDARRSRSIELPMPVVTCGHQKGDGRSMAMCKPYLVKYNGTATAYSIDVPIDTISTRDRFGLVSLELARAVRSASHSGQRAQGLLLRIGRQRFFLDILFRILTPRELARAQGFPDDYRFVGNTSAVVRQIGNAVPRRLARAITAAALTQIR